MWRVLATPGKDSFARFLADREPATTVMSERYRTEALDRRLRKGGRFYVYGDRAAVFHGPGGFFYPVGLAPDTPTGTELRATFGSFLKLYSIMGQRTDVDALASTFASTPTISIDYHLLHHPAVPKIQIPSPPHPELVITTPKPGEWKRLLPLQIAYEVEEVLLPGRRPNPAASKANLTESLRSQIVLVAHFRGEAIARVATNARGYTVDQIGGVYTDPSWRGRGLARWLMSHLMHRVAREGRGTSLFVKPHNTAALRLYDHLGFSFESGLPNKLLWVVVNILVVTSEYMHLAKVGGLADAVTGQAEGLAARGHTVTVVLPKYRGINTDAFQRDPQPLHVDLGNGTYGCAVLERELKGVQIRLIEHEDLFRRDGVYGPTPADAFADNLTRFALLSRGALEIAARTDRPVDILHVHDWPAGLGVIWLQTHYRETAAFSAVKTVLSIHNLGFQGNFSTDEARDVLGIPNDEAEDIGIADAGGINILKGAIHASDRIVTVSPTYATEIQQPRYGFGLHAVLQLRAPRLHGILNGIDTGIWNPDTDHYIPARYDVENLRGKRLCKEDLQDELDLEVNPDTPVIGTITRLTEQKGIDELFGVNYGVAQRLLEELPVQWIVLGTGERWCEDQIRELNRKYRNFVGLTMYSDTLAHRIEAGSDFFLMPSRYEPCGLNQMYSMRYGTIPIVTRTGGLVDTVDSTTGIHIEAHTPHAIYDAVRHAVNLFQKDRSAITAMQHAGMSNDFSVAQAVAQYEALYRDVQAL